MESGPHTEGLQNKAVKQNTLTNQILGLIIIKTNE